MKPNYSSNDNREALMRRIESRRLFEKPEKHYSIQETIEIYLSFITAARAEGDWRFLNTALKIGDWLEAREIKTEEMKQAEKQALDQLRSACGLS